MLLLQRVSFKTTRWDSNLEYSWDSLVRLDRTGWSLSFVIKDPTKPDNRRKYDAAFRGEALRLAEQSRSTQAAARALNIDPKHLYQWQKAAQTPVAAALGTALDPATAAELRQLWALARRQAQELDILKKAIASKRLRRVISQTETP